MTLYEIGRTNLKKLLPATLEGLGLREREDLQRLFREQIDVLLPDVLVIDEEYGNWEDSRRRIDLLALDRDANLVVIELKRTEDGGHMDLQAIRYAAMVSTMTFNQAVEAHGRFLSRIGAEGDPQERILTFLGWSEPDEDSFAQDVRIVLASGEFSKEITTAVMWLNERGLDIRCIRLQPYADGERRLLDVQQVIPLPEAEDYQVRVRQKASQERFARRGHSDRNERYLRFWTQLLATARTRTQLHANISPQPQSWVSATNHGLSYAYVFTRNSPRAELYIDRGDPATNASIFEEIEAHKKEIEQQFGGPLDWQPLENRRACRIAAAGPKADLENEESWSDLQKALIDTMISLENALRPFVDKYRSGASPLAD